MRQGMVLRNGTVFGSSMEPHFVGPRVVWRCPNCGSDNQFARDTIRLAMPTKCGQCLQVSQESPLDDLSDQNRTVEFLPGETIQFGRLRAIRALRKDNDQDSQLSDHGVKRGDVIVFQASPGSTTEIKRLVGLPNESIAINDGELIVNGERYCKSLDEALRQAVLVHTLNNLEERKNKVAFELKIDNQLACNAHDSHTIVVARDIGVAIQVAPTTNPWNATIMLQSACRDKGEYHVIVKLEKSGSGISLEWLNQTSVVSIDETKTIGNWIVVYLIDGYIVVGDEFQEWLRKEISFIESSDPTRDFARIEIDLSPKSRQFEQVLVFRDIEWRGVLDSGAQAWPSEEGIVLLGDNVSSSSDSRDRWEVRPGMESIKGIVIAPRNPIEALLKQREIRSQK